MPFSTETRKDFVLIRHEGEVTPDEINAARIEALRLVRTNGLSRLIIDIRDTTGDADPKDLRNMMEDNAKVTPPRPHAAVVVRADQYPTFRFIEDFAVSRGMPIRVFVDENEAMNWLTD
jgi:hypothetical protein